MKRFAFLLIVGILSACSTDAPCGDTSEAQTMSVSTAYLRAIEAGNWEHAQGKLSEDFALEGEDAPGFLSSDDKERALAAFKERRAAFPDMQFNEEFLELKRGFIRLRLRMTGTHAGTMNFSQGGFSSIQPTQRSVKLPYEYYDMKICDGKIAEIYAYQSGIAAYPEIRQQLGSVSTH